MTSVGPSSSQREVDQLTASWAKIEELVDDMRDLMPGILTGSASRYEYAASTVAIRLFQIQQHAKLAGRLSSSIQGRRQAMLVPPQMQHGQQQQQQINSAGAQHAQPPTPANKQPAAQQAVHPTMPNPVELAAPAAQLASSPATAATPAQRADGIH